MLKLHINNETSRLRAVILGIANSNGGIPKLEDCYDPKSIDHVLAGTYPKEQEMILEMDAVAQVFEKYDVQVFRPDIIENYNHVVTVTMKGSCSGCPSSTLTLKAGIENLLKRMVPEVESVEAEAA